MLLTKHWKLDLQPISYPTKKNNMYKNTVVCLTVHRNGIEASVPLGGKGVFPVEPPIALPSWATTVELTSYPLPTDVYRAVIRCGLFADPTVLHMCLVYNYCRAMRCHIHSRVCALSMETILSSWVQRPRPSRASPRRGGALTTRMGVRYGHTYLHSAFNTY